MNAGRIDALTSAEKRRHDEYLARAIHFGTCTEPADRSRSEDAFRRIYGWLDMPPPNVVWMDSPIQAVRMIFDSSQCDLLSDSVWDFIHDSLLNPLDESIMEVISPKLRNSIQSSLWREISRSLWDSIEASLYRLFWDPPRHPHWSIIEEALGGQLDLAWTTNYRFLESLRPGMYAPESVAMLETWNDVGESCGYWWPTEEGVIACERPRICRIDEDRVLHSDEGPALQYLNGSKVWAIHGVQLPELDGELIVFRPQDQTIAQIRAEKNEEVRRVRIERFGWRRYLSESGAVLVDGRTNDVDGTFESLLRLDDGEMRLLCACRSTGRVYALGVPREMAMAEQAQQWMASGGSLFQRRGICLGAS